MLFGLRGTTDRVVAKSMPGALIDGRKRAGQLWGLSGLKHITSLRRRPGNLNVIGSKCLIFCDEKYLCLHCLGNQKPVEWVFMMIRQSMKDIEVFGCDG